MASKLTKAKDISEATKKAVLDRQGGCSISGAWLGRGVEYHHVIPRSSEGLGVEWNIVALTPEEHRDFHDGKPIKVNGKPYFTNKEFATIMKNHLILNYYGWNVKDCKYQKGKDISDYKIIKRGKNDIKR